MTIIGLMIGAFFTGSGMYLWKLSDRMDIVQTKQASHGERISHIETEVVITREFLKSINEKLERIEQKLARQF